MSGVPPRLPIQVGAAVNPKKAVYIVRRSDEELLALLERGEYCNVLCSRQMGKTSLLHRTIGLLAKKSIRSSLIDVAGGLGAVSTPDDWYVGLLQILSADLDLSVDASDWWRRSRSATLNQRLLHFFREEVSHRLRERVVVFLDEIDYTFRLPYADDLFIAMRAMYNDRAREPAYEKLAFCLVGVATPNELIKDRRTTPYNLGHTIELQDFTSEHDDLSPLQAAISEDARFGTAVVREVLRWSGGHPYLTARLCEEFVRKGCHAPEDVKFLVDEGYSRFSELDRDTHFEQIQRFLQVRTTDPFEMWRLYRRIRRGERVPDGAGPTYAHLKLSGIVRRDALGWLVVRNAIYERVFDDRWAQEMMHNAGVRSRWSRWRGSPGRLMTAFLIVLLPVTWLVYSSFAGPRDLGPVAERLWQPGGDAGRIVAARSSYPIAERHHRCCAQLNAGTTLPTKDLASLENNHMGLAAAYLVRGDPGLVDDALQELESLNSVDADSERAMAYLVRGEPQRADFEQALHSAENALRKNERHGPALWNAALALQGLGLDLMAAQTFDQVARLDEPGWATEAQYRATRLRAKAIQVREVWEQANAAAEGLVKTGTWLPEAALNAPISRRFFYDAVRTRSSATEVLALLRLADQFDLRSGGTKLHDYVRWVASRDFETRGPVAAMYRRLMMTRDASTSSELLACGEPDIAIGAASLSSSGLDEKVLEKLATRVKALNAPWYDVLVLQKQAELAESTDQKTAVAILRSAIQISDAARLEDSSLQLRILLIGLQLRASETSAAWRDTEETWGMAVAKGDWETQRQVIELRALIARYSRDYPVGKAYLGEVIERTHENHLPAQELYCREQMALLELEHLNFEAAREQIDAAMATKLPLSSGGASVLGDLTRQRPSSVDAQAINAFRSGLALLPAGERALGNEIIGRWTIEVNPEEGRRLLREAIQQIGAPRNRDGDQSRVRAFAYSSLIMDAAKRKDYATVLTLIGEEAGAPFPATCAVGLALDLERAAVVVRGTSGELNGAYDGARKNPLPDTLDGFIPRQLLAGLEGCREIKVVARPPLWGRLYALPNRFAWSYLLLGRSPSWQGVQRQGMRLIVQSPAMSSKLQHLGLKVPRPIIPANPPPPGISVLQGLEATPNRILSELGNASDIDLVMQSRVDPRSGEASLYAAEGPEGDEITCTQVRATSLPNHPTVTLYGCFAAHTTPVLYGSRSLPAAFLLAGASVVFATDGDVSEEEAHMFFEDVRERMREGSSPALALNEVRQSWLSAKRGRHWIQNVLVFE